MIEIPLTGGLVALIDDEDAHLAALPWQPTGPRRGVYYAVRQEGGRLSRRSFYLHREVLGLVLGDGVRADHRNGDGLDCQRANLRRASAMLNAQNKKRSIVNTSGFVGVSFHKGVGRWRAYIMLAQREIHLGYFDTIAEAAKARAQAEVQLIGVHPQREHEILSALGEPNGD